MIIENVTFHNNKKQQMSGRIYSDNNKSRTGLIFSHGLFSSKDGYKITRLAKDIVNCGYTLFTFDFSFCGKSEGHISDLSVLQEVEDLKCAVNYFEDYGIKELHLMGSSMGGAVTILYSGQFKEKIKSVILIASPIEFREVIFSNNNLDHSDSFPDEGLTMLHNIPIKNKFFNEIKNLHLADIAKIICSPVLIIHGKDDEVVNVKNAYLLESKLKISKIIIIEHGDHSLTGEDNLEIIRNNIVPWLVEMK